MSLNRRAILAALAGLPFAAHAFGARAGIEIRFAITRDQHQPSGDLAQRTFENAMLMASGETLEVDFRGEYRIRMSVRADGDFVDVRLRLWDNHEEGELADAGEGSANVPIGGEATLTLLKSDNIQYSIVLKASRRTI